MRIKGNKGSQSAASRMRPLSDAVLPGRVKSSWSSCQHMKGVKIFSLFQLCRATSIDFLPIINLSYDFQRSNLVLSISQCQGSLDFEKRRASMAFSFVILSWMRRRSQFSLSKKHWSIQHLHPHTHHVVVSSFLYQIGLEVECHHANAGLDEHCNNWYAT